MTKTYTETNTNTSTVINGVMVNFNDFKLTSGSVLAALGWANPDDKIYSVETEKRIQEYYELNGGINQILDLNGELHIFYRRGNDWFSYVEPLDEWFNN